MQYDAAVVGAGPAGMMAAIAAAKNGARVVLIEKNQDAGRKLLLTGGGRCNLANAEFDLRELVAHYGKNGAFLFHAFSEFGPKEAIGFFNDLGVKTKIENNGRVFPKSGRAREVLDALIDKLDELNVEIVYNNKVVAVKEKGNLIDGIVLQNGDDIIAKNYIIAAGGKSYPQTGSAGDGYVWAQKLGHKIDELSLALAPIKIQESWIKELAGVSLAGVKISVLQNNKKIARARGEMLFTHFGVSGPAVLNISAVVAESIKNGSVEILLDLLPDKNIEILEQEILKDFFQNPNRAAKNCLARYASINFIQALLKQIGVDGEKTANDITKSERRRIVATLKNIKLSATGTSGIELGMVTGGGVDTAQIDGKTMRSKIIGNLYFAGEIINVHGATGGFNLLQCWSTGHLAGASAVKSDYLTID